MIQILSGYYYRSSIMIVTSYFNLDAALGKLLLHFIPDIAIKKKMAFLTDDHYPLNKGLPLSFTVDRDMI